MSLADLLKLLPIERLRNPPPVVAVVRLEGVIGSPDKKELRLDETIGGQTVIRIE